MFVLRYASRTIKIFTRKELFRQLIEIWATDPGAEIRLRREG